MPIRIDIETITLRITELSGTLFKTIKEKVDPVSASIIETENNLKENLDSAKRFDFKSMDID
jgi:hypothetical protein